MENINFKKYNYYLKTAISNDEIEEVIKSKEILYCTALLMNNEIVLENNALIKLFNIVIDKTYKLFNRHVEFLKTMQPVIEGVAHHINDNNYKVIFNNFGILLVDVYRYFIFGFIKELNISKENSDELINFIKNKYSKEINNLSNGSNRLLSKLFSKYYNTIDIPENILSQISWSDLAYLDCLSEDLIEKYSDRFDEDDWRHISSISYLTEDFIRKYKDKLNWISLSIHQKFSEKFIIEFSDYVDWCMISGYQYLSEDFINKYSDKLNWENLSKKQKLSDEFILNNIDKLDLVDLFVFNYNVRDREKSDLLKTFLRCKGYDTKKEFGF